MTKMTIARRYAKALLILAKKEKRVQEISDELSSLSVLIERVKKFWEVVNNPLFDLDRRQEVLAEVARATGMSQAVLGLLRLLLVKNRMRYLPFIVSGYHEMANESLGRVRARVYSAVDLTKEEGEKIKKKLAVVTGREVILETIRDPSLIGGAVTKIGGLVLDGSLRTQLLKIKESVARG
jgi:F-type H+-transporting ATPase subunit delta